jgi:hypothetical protein
MTPFSRQSQLSKRQPWTLECLLHERAIALGFTLAKSTSASYDSALTSYIQFCRLHDLALTPTPDTFSFYVVWMSSYILPTSVDSYLSGICNKLEDEFPDIRAVRQSRLLQRTLAGCKRRYNHPINRKQPLSRDDLHIAFLCYHTSDEHDDKLFLAQLYFGFETLQCLGELVWPDASKLQSYSRVAMQHTVHFSADSVEYTIPLSKSDKFGHGSQVLVQRSSYDDDCLAIFSWYLQSRDSLFSHYPELWLRTNSHIPTRSWFTARFQRIFENRGFTGHSMRAGGATALALAGAAPQVIQAAGRWSSDEFQKYIRIHPFILQAIIHASSS